MPSVESAAAEVPGVVGVSAKHLGSGAEIRLRDDVVYFAASTIKVPLLVELYRQVDAGEIDLERRVELSDQIRAPGSGVLKELATGLQPTVRDLALLMIIISDNTATDYLYHLVGPRRLDETMRRLGLSKTRIPMSTRVLLYSITGVDTDDIALGNKLAKERLSRQEIDAESDAVSEERSDVSSPADMSRLLELVQRGEVLSQTSREAVLDILKRQQLNSIIPCILVWCVTITSLRWVGVRQTDYS